MNLQEPPSLKVLVSDITGKTLILNSSDSAFAISPNFSGSRVRTAMRDYVRYTKGLPYKNRPFGRMFPLFEAFTKVRSRADFVVTLAELFERGPGLCKPNNVNRIRELLVVLRRVNALIWPRDFDSVFHNANLMVTSWALEDPSTSSGANRILTDFESLTKKKTKAAQNKPMRVLFAIIMSVDGIAECGDLAPAAFDGRLVGSLFGQAVARGVLTLIHAQYPDIHIPYTHDDYGPFYTPGRSDERFRWVLDSDPKLETWRAACETWLALQKGSRLGKRGALNVLLDLLVQDPQKTRDPLKAMRSDERCISMDDFSSRSLDNQRGHLRFLQLFFDWFLDTYCVEESDDGLPYRLPGFRNPISTSALPLATPFESHREALPTRYIRILKEIITENNFAWPRKYGTAKSKDLVDWLNPETNKWEQVWSPVRAFVILIKLELPLRTFQVRMLNSGEADELRYDTLSRQWTKNGSALSKHHGSKSGGVLRAINQRSNAQQYVGLYINTNKTRDANSSSRERGYVIPWQQERAIELLSELRTWQEKYNPLRAPTLWTDLREPYFAETYHADVLRERGAETEAGPLSWRVVV